MPVNETPALRLPYIAPSQAQKHVTHNEALRMLDAIVQLSVLDRDRASAPAGPAEGDRYLVAAAATGVWSGHEKEVAAFQDGAWSFYQPLPGWIAWVAGEGRAVSWSGAEWEPFPNSAEALHNVKLLGVGTAADTVNPFAAKLNKALWSARYVAEGGDGDLRYTLNKEAAANTLSLLMQSAWSGRAEIGLTGDDDLHVKVSADGSTWTDALKVATDGSGVTVSRPTAVTLGDWPAGSGNALAIDVGANIGLFQATRYMEGNPGAVFFFRKARGSQAAPAAVQAGDTLGGFRGYGHDGVGFASGVNGVAFLLEASDNWARGISYGTQIRFFTTGNGTTANTERLRIANDGDLQMGGANTVINSNRHPVLRSYTVSTLPSASPEGQLIYVGDGSGSKRVAVSTGAGWRFADGSVVS